MVDVSSECPCRLCAANTATRAVHARVRALAAYVPLEQRAFFASQLDHARVLGMVDDALAADICGGAVEDVRRHRGVEAEFAGHEEDLLEQLGADAATRALLHQAWRRRFDWAEEIATGSREPMELALRVHGVRLRVSCPASKVSFLMVFETFLAEPYRVTEPAPVIFDLGANIGLSTLCFHALFPGIAIVCVEPVTENLRFLDENGNTVTWTFRATRRGSTGGNA